MVNSQIPVSVLTAVKCPSPYPKHMLLVRLVEALSWKFNQLMRAHFCDLGIPEPELESRMLNCWRKGMASTFQARGFVTTGCCWHLSRRVSCESHSYDHICPCHVTGWVLSRPSTGNTMTVRKLIRTVCCSQLVFKTGGEWKQSALQVNYCGRQIQFSLRWITTNFVCCVSLSLYRQKLFYVWL